MIPKDFYFFNLLENDFPNLPYFQFHFLIIEKFTGVSQEELGSLPSLWVIKLFKWMDREILEGKVMKVEQWLELAFHLCKQRWDSSVDWLENQPVSKILLMADIQSKFVEKQNEENKKAARRRK
jgi:hypothetical protein